MNSPDLEQTNQASELVPSWWTWKHQIKTETGATIDLADDYRFLRAFYDDECLFICAEKAAQIGFSTAAINKKLHASKNKHLDVIYVLPTVDEVRTFVSGKVNRIIGLNPILQEYVKDKDSIEQKQVGGNMIYYRGTQSEREALMISGDLLIVDEEDRANQIILGQFSSRLQASNYKGEWHFSNPSVPGSGVDKYWQISDQKHWFVTCDCGYEQFISWPESFDMQKEIYVCKDCGAEITDEQRRMGRWVAKYARDKVRKYSGYWIPLWLRPSVTASMVIEYERTKTPEYFDIFVCGKPHIGSGNKLTQDLLFQNLVSERELEGRLIIGVDTGTTTWMVWGDTKGLLGWAKEVGYDAVEALLKRFPTAIAVFDAGGDLMMPRKLQDKYPGRIFLTHYAADRKTQELVRWGQGEEMGTVNADRNRVIQMLVDEYSAKQISLKGTRESWWDYWLHWNNIYRVQEENALGVLVKKWERSGDDHLVHATVYWWIGKSRFGSVGQIGHVVSAKKPELIEQVSPGVFRANPEAMRVKKKTDDWRKRG